jgi:FtsH-binding integral membrane protein
MALAWWYYVIQLVVAILFAWLCAALAARKGRSPVLFGILGFFFLFITLIVVLVISDKNRA